ncbi:SDR family NAD(P)-dependent oxidoreductase [Planctomicrobium sp. SH668]|uniref:SDR family NAD(P)-dependent oxidoreductase n=1 Tax=Planctomicrobium sp. SH668 TaxID=3448126 RepID=UPI003F5BC2EB
MTSAPPNEFASLKGKRALVTGSSSGIGRGIALELARAGCDVIVHYAMSRDSAECVAKEIEDLQVKSAVLQCDFLEDDFSSFVDEAWNLWGSLDIWVNNAGADLLTGGGKSLSFHEKLDAVWLVDVLGTVELGRALTARMKQRGSGVILNIGWDQADRGMEGDSAELFSTTKNAIMGFTRSLALTAAPEVRVNCIAPGWIQTAWGDVANSEWQERVIRETPLRRWGKPEDIANLARFLVSDSAAYITGQVINANGGAVR